MAIIAAMMYRAIMPGLFRGETGMCCGREGMCAVRNGSSAAALDDHMLFKFKRFD